MSRPRHPLLLHPLVSVFDIAVESLSTAPARKAVVTIAGP